MTATEYYIDGMVEVKYCSHHTNHQLGVGECRNLPLPNSVKEDIQQQFAAGITIEQIMDSKFIIVHLILVTRTRVVYRICIEVTYHYVSLQIPLLQAVLQSKNVYYVLPPPPKKQMQPSLEMF